MADTLPAIRSRHDAEVRAAVRAALVASGWRALTAAATLDAPEWAVRRIIASDDTLAAEYRANTPGRGGRRW